MWLLYQSRKILCHRLCAIWDYPTSLHFCTLFHTIIFFICHFTFWLIKVLDWRLKAKYILNFVNWALTYAACIDIVCLQDFTKGILYRRGDREAYWSHSKRRHRSGECKSWICEYFLCFSFRSTSMFFRSTSIVSAYMKQLGVLSLPPACDVCNGRDDAELINQACIEIFLYKWRACLALWLLENRGESKQIKAELAPPTTPDLVNCLLSLNTMLVCLLLWSAFHAGYAGVGWVGKRHVCWHWQYIWDWYSAFVLFQGSATLSMAYAGTKFISSVSTVQGMSNTVFFFI